MTEEKNLCYNKPKVGDTVVCIDDDSSDEDLGMSSIVLKGTVGLKVGDIYTITDLDFYNYRRKIPLEHGQKRYTREEFKKVNWHFTMAYLKDSENKSFRVLLGCFEPTKTMKNVKK